ncbi:MAG: hypothetical protein RBR67_07525 [Desulfobacterium sp.]|nr:hypothetical protein [Desulfobacterium sp.]
MTDTKMIPTTGKNPFLLSVCVGLESGFDEAFDPSERASKSLKQLRSESHWGQESLLGEIFSNRHMGQVISVTISTW